MDLQADRAKYQADRRKDILLSATRGIVAAGPGGAGGQAAAFPTGFEPKLIALAYAFERATRRRIAPPLCP